MILFMLIKYITNNVNIFISRLIIIIFINNIL